MDDLALFDNSHRPDRLVMPACSECNRSTGTSDLVAAMTSRWDFYANSQSQIDHSKLSAQIKPQAPEIVREGLDGIWIKPDAPLEEHPHFLKENG
jgi:hypothetical protein